MELFWTSLFWAWDAPILAEQGDYVIWWVEMSWKYCISRLNFLHKSDINVFNNPIKNGVSFVSKYERVKNISISVRVKWSSKDDMIQALDDLRKAIYRDNINIDIKFKTWEIRRIRANCTSFPVEFAHYNIDFLSLDISFETIDPFFYKINNQVRTRTWITWNFREEITAEGTATADLTTYIFFWSVTWTTSFSITGQRKTITVSETFATDDILKINWLDRSVTLNDVEIDYDGEFPEIFPNTNFIDVSWNGTWAASVVFVNRKNYV